MDPITHPNPNSLRSILMCSSHLRLGLLSDHSPSGFPTKILYAFLILPMRPTCPAHLIFLDLITLVISGERGHSYYYKCSDDPSRTYGGHPWPLFGSTESTFVSLWGEKTDRYNQRYFYKETGSGMHIVTKNSIGGGIIFLSRDVQNMLACLKKER
jgi:hypothetical protein